MKKYVIAGLTSMAMASSAFAQTTTTIYGSIDAGVAYISNLGGGSVMRVDQGMTQPDRIGFKGVEDLGGGMKAGFQLEGGFYSDTGAQTNSTKLFNRNSTVYLSSELGTVSLGHMPDVVFDYAGKLSNAYQGNSWYLFHPGNLDSLANSYQFDNAVRYTSPTMAGLQISAIYGFGEVAGQSSSGRNISAGATYTTGPFRAVVAYSKLNDRPAGFATGFLTVLGLGTATTVFNSLTTTAVGGAYTDGNWRANLLYTQVKMDIPARAMMTQKNYDANLSYRYTAANTVTVGYTLSNLEGARWGTVSLGNMYALSKRTDIYAQVAYERAGSNAKFAIMNGAGAAGGTGASSNRNEMATIVGVHHSF